MSGDGRRRQVSAEVIARVLRDTLSMSSVAETASESDLEIVNEVGQRHHGLPLTREPVVRDLVSALLESYFGFSLAADVVGEVADTVYDDPTARAKLVEIWAEISR